MPCRTRRYMVRLLLKRSQCRSTIPTSCGTYLLVTSLHQSPVSRKSQKCRTATKRETVPKWLSNNTCTLRDLITSHDALPIVAFEPVAGSRWNSMSFTFILIIIISTYKCLPYTRLALICNDIIDPIEPLATHDWT